MPSFNHRKLPNLSDFTTKIKSEQPALSKSSHYPSTHQPLPAKLTYHAARQVWHFYLGGPLSVVELDADAPGQARITTLGHDILGDALVQHTVRTELTVCLPTWQPTNLPASLPVCPVLNAFKPTNVL